MARGTEGQRDRGMKGVIYNHFLDYVEEEYSYRMVDRVILESDLPSNGEYTDVGDYHYEEMVSLMTSLSRQVDIPVETLLINFGRSLFSILVTKMPDELLSCKEPFELLSKVDGLIHREVLKINPDAEVPHIDFEVRGKAEAVVRYESCRPFAKLAEGMLLGCSDYFDGKYTVRMLDGHVQSPRICAFKLTLVERASSEVRV